LETKTKARDSATQAASGGAGGGLAICRVKLESLHLDPANARAHGEENMEAIAASLQRFGQAEPLVVSARTHRVIGGNGRLAAMRKLNWTECDVVELDLSDLESTALGIALNRTSELATWDQESLARLLGELRAEEALAGVGFDSDDLDEILSDLAALEEAEGVDDPGPEDPPQNPVAQRGDLWILGEHRLMCGDSTNVGDVRRLMGDEQAALCASDPPYLVDYTGERPNDSGKDWTASYKEVEIKDAQKFFRSVFENILEVIAPHSAIYCWHAHKRCGLIQEIWEDLGILDHQQIVWIKPTAVFGRVFWHFRHEPCMMGWAKGSKPEHDGHHEFDSVWEVDFEGKQRLSCPDHPTSKPVELFARPMRKHTKPGSVCFEPFSGSGSQLIAAETLKRKCRAMEISPPFVDVAIRRWQTATGKVALLDGDGRAFADVAAERGSDGQPNP